MATANDLLTRAIDETKHLNHNEIFLVRDLFKGYEWNRISRSDRLLLGTLFLNYVHTTGTYIEPIEKTSSRQQKYRYRDCRQLELQFTIIPYFNIIIIAFCNCYFK